MHFNNISQQPRYDCFVLKFDERLKFETSQPATVNAKIILLFGKAMQLRRQLVTYI